MLANSKVSSVKVFAIKSVRARLVHCLQPGSDGIYEILTPGIYSLLSEAAARVHVDQIACSPPANAPSSSEHMDNPFMARAIQLSIDNVSSGRGGPFGAVVVKDRKIIAEGTNQVTSTNDPTAHAEVIAIRETCRKLGTFDLQDCD